MGLQMRRTAPHAGSNKYKGANGGRRVYVNDLAPALCSVTFRQLPLSEVVELAAASGLQAIEWGADVHVPPGDLRKGRIARTLTEERGLCVASYGSYIRPTHDEADAFEIVLETASALGAPNIRVWAGPMGRGSDSYQAAERMVVADAIRSMATKAAAAGITLGLEYHRGTLTDDLASAKALLAEVSHPCVFSYWQPRPGLPLPLALEEIKALSSDLSHIHVFAWDEQARRYPLHTQADYWDSALSAPCAGRWQGTRYAMLEFVQDNSPERFTADAATLLKLLERSAVGA
jgi:sugar phosphate isomerase/epimerase